MKLLLALFLLTFLLITSCNTYTQGERIYQLKCANCHGINGEGLADLYPSISSSDIIKQNIKILPCIIIKGKFTLNDKGEKISEMPPVHDMGDVELSNLLNYLQNKYGKKKETISMDSLIQWKSRCE
jgi:mono/diheme cytochrome c family protein